MKTNPKNSKNAFGFTQTTFTSKTVIVARIQNLATYRLVKDAHPGSRTLDVESGLSQPPRLHNPQIDRVTLLFRRSSRIP